MKTRTWLWQIGVHGGLLLFTLCACSRADASTPGILRLTARSFEDHPTLPFDSGWLRHAGDDPAWSQPGTPDSGWTRVAKTWVRSENAAREGFGGVSWFRQHFTVDSSLGTAYVYLTVANCGPLEMYLDGKRIHFLGTVSADPARESAICGQYCNPIRLESRPGVEHIMAVRFSNHQISRFRASGTVIGFRSELNLGDESGPFQPARYVVHTIGWSVIAGLCAVLLVLHLMIYFNYRAARENLTFSVFTGALCVLSLNLVLMANTRVISLDRLWMDAALLRVLVMLITLTGLHFVHEIATVWKWIRSPYIWIVIFAGSIAAAVMSSPMVYAVAMLLMIELVRSLVIAVRARVEKVWIVSVGFAAFILALAGEFLMVTGIVEYRTYMDMMPLMGLAGLAISMSIYLGTRIAAVNRSLAESVEAGRKAVRALVESEGRYRTMIENTVAGVGIVDDQNRLIFANDRYAEILGMHKEDMIGKNGYDPIVPEHLEGVRTRIEKLMRGEARQVEHEFDIFGADGKRRSVLCSASLYTTRDGRKNLVVYSTDVTDYREVERKQREAVAVAERTARMASIGVMAGGITHEINQPLNAIVLHAETLLYMAQHDKLQQKEAVQGALKQIVLGTERISEIIQHMRSFWVSSPGNGGELITEDLNAPVRHALQLTEQKIRAHAIEVVLDLSSQPLPVKVDSLQLEQIVINLITNAVSALDKSSKSHKEIGIRTYREGDDVGLEVSDNGPGLPSMATDKLFDPFFSTGKDKGGTGLGLAIVRMFVEKFKGTVSGRNGENGGAILSVRLPVSCEVVQPHAHSLS